MSQNLAGTRSEDVIILQETINDSDSDWCWLELDWHLARHEEEKKIIIKNIMYGVY